MFHGCFRLMAFEQILYEIYECLQLMAAQGQLDQLVCILMTCAKAPWLTREVKVFARISVGVQQPHTNEKSEKRKKFFKEKIRGGKREEEKNTLIVKFVALSSSEINATAATAK